MLFLLELLLLFCSFSVLLKKLVYITEEEEGIMIERKGINVGLDLFHHLKIDLSMEQGHVLARRGKSYNKHT